MLGFYIFAVVIVLLASAVAGWFAAVDKNAGTQGALLGLLAGPLGVIAALGLDRRRACRTCGGKLNGKPQVCPHCKSKFDWPRERHSARTGEHRPSAPQFDE